MEVSRSEWKTKASENITRYLHRGGNLRGDDPQLLGGSSLLNTIGTAMNLPMRDPRNWSSREMALALENRLVYFEGDARKTIDVISNAIISCCGGDSENFVTVLPVELYFDGKLYELPLFRVKRYKDSKSYYIDNIGRCYDSEDDWTSNNKLPPCEIAYPFRLRLTGNSSKYATISFSESAAAGALSQVARGVDVGAAVTGLTASVGLLFVSGGLAAPLVATAVGSAVWGSCRSGYHLVDKASHGESINPFTDQSSRMLWLGLAANIASFGAMGASMRLASLAARGRNITTAFTVIVDVVNGTSVALSSIAIIDSTIYVCEHYKELSKYDILMHTASMAFWTKGLYTYKTATTIINDARNQAFSSIYKELTKEQAKEMENIRSTINNDANLLARFQAAGEFNMSPKEYSLILIDAQKIMNNLNSNEAQTFMTMRDILKNDIALISALREVGNMQGISTSDAAKQVVNFWQKTQQYNLPAKIEVKMTDGGLVIGRAPVIRISQLPQFSDSMVQFVSQQLSRLDVNSAGEWSSSIDVLLKLQDHGMFTGMATNIVPRGRAVVNLNSNLQISIYKLISIPKADLKIMFEVIKSLDTNATTESLSKEAKRLGKDYLLKFECQRREALADVKQYAQGSTSLIELVSKDLQNFERDRLITFVDTVENFEVELYVQKLMTFVETMKPNNISELVAYSEFAVKYVEKYKNALKDQGVKPITQERGVKYATWLRKEASRRAFADPEAIRAELASLRRVVASCGMARISSVGSGLSNAALGDAIRTLAASGDIRFASELSAAYHVFKHGKADAAANYVTLANRTIADPATRVTAVHTMQDGDARRVDFEGPLGTASVLERAGRVWLCTFQPLQRN